MIPTIYLITVWGVPLRPNSAIGWAQQSGLVLLKDNLVDRVIAMAHYSSWLLICFYMNLWFFCMFEEEAGKGNARPVLPCCKHALENLSGRQYFSNGKRGPVAHLPIQWYPEVQISLRAFSVSLTAALPGYSCLLDIYTPSPYLFPKAKAGRL